jgi:cytidylate kinase
MDRKIVIAIDGPSGVGKSTIARLIAEQFGLTYIDTGAMYRAFTVSINMRGIDIENDDALRAFCKVVNISFADNGTCVLLNGEDLSKRIRAPWVGEATSLFSAKLFVRERMVELQQRLGSEGGVVMEGRDIGTVVLPDADIKIYLDANEDERARRRHKELQEESLDVNLKDVTKDMQSRDKRDSERDNSPLVKADGAIEINTTELSLGEVTEKVLKLVSEAINGLGK